jgi:hypothetical protein
MGEPGDRIEFEQRRRSGLGIGLFSARMPGGGKWIHGDRRWDAGASP